MGAIMAGFKGKKETPPPAPASSVVEKRDTTAFEAGRRIDHLEKTLSALMFGESKDLTAAQQRWVDTARSKMTDADASDFSRMKTTEEIYGLASELHRRMQADPLTRYRPGT